MKRRRRRQSPFERGRALTPGIGACRRFAHEGENHIDCAAAENARSRPIHEWGSLVLSPAVSMVPLGPQGRHDHPARDSRTLASGRLPSVLALESGSLGGRPKIAADLRALIRRISAENPLWGAPRIHGELLKLGFEVAQSSVAKYMVKRCGPPSQGWRTFLRNHAPDIAAMDLFVVPTMGFDLLYVLVIVRLARRDLVWINVTTHPTADWIARQITEAFPWDKAPHYLIRDRDQVYGAAATRRLRAMGIRDKPIAPGSPWQNGFAERLIGSIRRECVDHIVVLGETHLRRVLKSYARYYNETRTHRSLDKDAPISRPVQRAGSIISHALLGGLHHHYVRV
jgi:transposase InsO family protein